jgi:DNA polymerase-3 subunit alpha
MDFEDAKRDGVKAYLVEKWGRDNASSVGTYGTQKGKQALKDVGRVFGVPWQETQKVTDLIIQRAWGDARASYTIEDTFEQFDAAKEYKRKYPDVVKYAMKFEGRIRQRGIHASGVEVAPFPLTDIIPIETTGHGKEREVITGIDHREADELGLVKMDVLGLATLTIVKQTIDLVKERTGQEVDLYGVDRDDPLVFEKFTEGKCAGIFQVNTIGFIKMCMEAPMKDVDDLAVVLALYRPGAMRSGLAQDYLKRSQGKSKVKPVHPIYDEITQDTAGCIIYQEQVMAFFSKMANWSASEVDAGRRTMAKSYGVDKLNEERPKFIEGALDNEAYVEGLTDEQSKEPESVANRIYDMILHFGSYGFNKSHAVAYAMISYWTMWLKVHYPNEFYSVLLSREPDDDNIRRFITEMRQEGIKLLPPDINKSMADFSLDDDGVRAGLAKIKNVGENAVAAILEHRPYKGMDDFLSRVNRRIVNKRVIANLIKVGAFSEWYPDRAELLAKFEVAAGKKGKMIDDIEVEVEPWDEETYIRTVTSIYPIPTEKHITEYYGDVLDQVIKSFTKIEAMEEHVNEVVYECGTIQDIKFNRVGDFDLKERTDEQKKASKNYGQRYANVNMEDGTGYRRHKFSVDAYMVHQSVLEKGEGTPVIVKARVDKQRDINYILDLTELDDFRERLREGIALTHFQQSLIKNSLEPYAPLREAYDIPYIEDLDTSLKSIKIMGEVAYVKEYHARNGLMLFAGLEDETGYFDLIVWADAYAKFEKYLKMGNLIVVKASRVKDGKYAVDIGKNDRIVLAKTMLRRL